MQFSASMLLALGAILHMAAAAPALPSLFARDCPSQKLDPAGIICKVNSDCTDPCYPTCTCGSVVISTVVGVDPTYIYNCAKNSDINGCLNEG